MGSDEPNVARCPVCRAVIEGWDGKGGGVIGIKVRTARHIMKGYSLRKAHRDPSYDLYNKYVMELLYTSVCYVLIFQCCKFMKDLRTPLLSTIACIYRSDFESPLQIKSLPLTLPPCDAVFFL